MTTPDETVLQLTCDREDLLQALQIADAVVPSTSSKPILTNIHLIAEAGQLDILATDQQIGLRAVLRRLSVDQTGSVVVPARQTVSILRESQSPNVYLRVERSSGGNIMHLELADGDYRVPGISGDSFPEVGGYPAEADSVILPGIELERMIRKTIFAVDKERSSAVLSGLLFKVADGECLLAATDGKVLSEAVFTHDSLTGVDWQAVVPASTINHLQRVIGASKPDEVAVAVSDRLFCAQVAVRGRQGEVVTQVELVSRLVDGHFPSYRNAMPKEPQGTATFRRDELASAVRRVALMTSNASRAIVFELGHDQVILSNLNVTTGSARIPVPCVHDGGDERFGLNSQFLGEVMRAFDQEEITWELNGAGRGLIAREPGSTFLLMPITLHSN